jgi:hypothetical protein
MVTGNDDEVIFYGMESWVPDVLKGPWEHNYGFPDYDFNGGTVWRATPANISGWSITFIDKYWDPSKYRYNPY